MDCRRLNDFSRVAPFVMSLLCLLLVLDGIRIFGLHSGGGADEGTDAHIFQILMVLQVPIIAIFAGTTSWRPAKQPALIVILQFVAYLVPLAALRFLLAG
jgi:hypothetical protein